MHHGGEAVVPGRHDDGGHVRTASRSDGKLTAPAREYPGNIDVSFNEMVLVFELHPFFVGRQILMRDQKILQAPQWQTSWKVLQQPRGIWLEVLVCWF